MGETKDIQLVNEIFCSVYNKDYVFWEHHKRAVGELGFDSHEMLPEMADRFLNVEAKPDFSKMERYEEDLKELNKLRLRTTYNCEYVPKSSYKTLRNVDPNKFSPENDKYLTDGAILMGVPQGKVLPPLPTSRRVFAYSSYDDYRTPLSTYQDTHGRCGYDRARLAADGGYWRMGPRYDHEKEMDDIKKVMMRESEILEREKEEKLRAEQLMKTQLEEERMSEITRSQKSRSLKDKISSKSSRFGVDPRTLSQK